MPVRRGRQATYARRRRRRMARVEHDLTSEQWDALQVAWSGCAYCGATGVPLQRDCVLPISLGGRYTVQNVVPACRSCNASKWHQEVTTWLRRRRLDERAFLLRWLEICGALAQRDPIGAESLSQRPDPIHAEEEAHGDDRHCPPLRPPGARLTP